MIPMQFFDWNGWNHDHLNVSFEANKDASLWILGISMAILAAILGSLAFNIQKYAFIKYDPTQGDYAKRKRTIIWIGGFILFAISNIGTLLALIYSAQSIIAPLGCIGLISNAVFASKINHEMLMWADYLGLSLCIIGSVLVLITGDVKNDQSVTPNQNVHNVFLYNPGAITLTICLCITMIPLYLYLVWIEIYKPNFRNLSMIQDINQSNSNNDCDLIENGDNESDALLSLVSDNAKSQSSASIIMPRSPALIVRLTPYAYPFLSGCCSASVSLLVKCFVLLIKRSSNDIFLIFTWPVTYTIITAVLFCAISQLFWFNLGLKRYDASVQVPIFHITYTILSVLYGMTYFNEVSNLSVLSIIGFITGVIVICIGSFFLTWKMFHSWR